MKLTLKPEVIETLEDLTGKKITRNGNQVIQEVCEMAEKQNENEGIDISVCSRTEEITKDDEK